MRSLYEWPSTRKPDRSSTCATVRRSTGMVVTDCVYAVDVNRPRNRRSPTTLPCSSNTFTPT